MSRRNVLILAAALTLVFVFSTTFNSTSASQPCRCRDHEPCVAFGECPPQTACKISYPPECCVKLICTFAGVPEESICCYY